VFIAINQKIIPKLTKMTKETDFGLVADLASYFKENTPNKLNALV
jgi:hypothetical protein